MSVQFQRKFTYVICLTQNPVSLRKSGSISPKVSKAFARIRSHLHEPCFPRPLSVSSSANKVDYETKVEMRSETTDKAELQFPVNFALLVHLTPLDGHG